MATVLDYAKITANLEWSFTNQIDGPDAKYLGYLKFLDTFSDGNAIDKAELVVHQQNTVTAGATNNVDLAAGLTDIYGNTVTFTKLKCILLQNLSTTAGDVIHLARPTDSAGTTTDFGVPLLSPESALIKIGPGGFFLWWVPSAAAVTVTATTGEDLSIIEAGGANTVSYRLTLIGTDS